MIVLRTNSHNKERFDVFTAEEQNSATLSVKFFFGLELTLQSAMAIIEQLADAGQAKYKIL